MLQFEDTLETSVASYCTIDSLEYDPRSVPLWYHPSGRRAISHRAQTQLAQRIAGFLGLQVSSVH
jgi:hypothetical protein